MHSWTGFSKIQNQSFCKKGWGAQPPKNREKPELPTLPGKPALKAVVSLKMGKKNKQTLGKHHVLFDKP